MITKFNRKSTVPFFCFSAKYVGSLARIRTGISDAFVSCEILDVLVEKLTSPSVPNTSEDAGDEVEMRSACSVAIGALSYNRTAFRLLYNAVRREPSKKWTKNKMKICECFIFFPIKVSTKNFFITVDVHVCRPISQRFSKVNVRKDCRSTGFLRAFKRQNENSFLLVPVFRFNFTFSKLVRRPEVGNSIVSFLF